MPSGAEQSKETLNSGGLGTGWGAGKITLVDRQLEGGVIGVGGRLAVVGGQRRQLRAGRHQHRGFRVAPLHLALHLLQHRRLGEGRTQTLSEYTHHIHDIGSKLSTTQKNITKVSGCTVSKQSNSCAC